MAERTFDDFDDFANDYRDIHSRNVKLSGADSFYFAEMKVKYLASFENNELIRVLDVGCGDGVTEYFIEKHFSNWKVKGIDVSQKSIEAAREKKLPNAEFCVYDGMKFPVEGESVDIVFIAGVLHHINYALHKNLLNEVFRVLKKAGRLYLFEHNPLNPLTRYLVNTCVFDKDARLLKSNYTSKMISGAGLKLLKKEFIIFFPRKGLLAKLIFLEKYLKWLPLGGQYFLSAKK